MHLAVLSVKLKVSVRQLEALEADEHEVLKGTAFVRALAQAVCRQLGVDPAPILAALPHTVQAAQIESAALKTRRQPLPAQQSRDSGKGLSRQVLVLAILMLLGAAALIWWPDTSRNDASGKEENQDPTQAAVPMGQASDPMALPVTAASDEQPASASTPASDSTPSTPMPAVPAASTAVARMPQASVPAASAPLAAGSAAASNTLFQIGLKADAWVEVRDSRGQMVLKRTVKAGETLQLSPLAPFFVYVSKADSAELRWQGQAVDLRPHTQNNEARLQIKP